MNQVYGIKQPLVLALLEQYSQNPVNMNAGTKKSALQLLYFSE